jgi:hypothetical protein
MNNLRFRLFEMRKVSRLKQKEKERLPMKHFQAGIGTTEEERDKDRIKSQQMGFTFFNLDRT